MEAADLEKIAEIQQRVRRVTEELILIKKEIDAIRTLVLQKEDKEIRYYNLSPRPKSLFFRIFKRR